MTVTPQEPGAAWPRLDDSALAASA
ncbi:MAG: hypothetical protein JWN54_1358, partial [Mycobacterium sp.]|nr:hypothetical protein [Mycobacterium sp.]